MHIRPVHPSHIKPKNVLIGLPDGDGGLLAYPTEDGGLAVLGDVVGHLKVTEGSGSLGNKDR